MAASLEKTDSLNGNASGTTSLHKRRSAASVVPFDDSDMGHQKEGDGAEVQKRPHPAVQAVWAIDFYAMKPKQATMLGGIVSVLALCGLIVYSVYVIVGWVRQPYLVTSHSLWTYNNGPWPLRMRCRAVSGCYVSNRIQTRWSNGVQQRDPGAQQLCTQLQPGDWVDFDVIFSNSPNDGISIIFIPGPSTGMTLPLGSLPDTVVPTNFGIEMESILACGNSSDPSCLQGAQQLLTPVTTGLTELFFVETTNASSKGAGAFRREWYPSQTNTDGTIMSLATTCDVTNFNSSFKQARIRLNAQWAQVTVDKDTLWLILWGTIGGACGLMLQIGGIVLGAISIIMQLSNRRRDEQEAS